jgi:hypothetical protein
MDDNPYQSPSTSGAPPDRPILPDRDFDRQLIYGLGINVGTLLFASMILDGGWIARHDVPFCIAHLIVIAILWLRARRRGNAWTAGERAFLVFGAPIGLLIAAAIAYLRY